jgi:hypothetical protein
MIIWSILSAAAIGAMVALLVLPFRKRLSTRWAIVAVSGLCVLYDTAAFGVMVSGGTPIKSLNAFLVLSILPAWGLGAPTGEMGWGLLISFLGQALAASAIGFWIYHMGKKQQNREQKVGQVSSEGALSDEPST